MIPIRLGSGALAVAASFALACGAPPNPGRGGAATPRGSVEKRVPAASEEVAVATAPAQGAATAAGAIGGAYPTTVERAARNGRWVVYCQATEDTDRNGELAVTVGPRGELRGDELTPYLAVGNAEPLPIDALWAVEPSERWLAVKLAGQAVVVDTNDGRRTPLVEADVDLIESGETYPLHRALGFEAQTGALLFSRTLTEGGFELRALAPAGGAASRKFLGQGKLQRLQLSWDGAWIVVDAVTEDTNQNGRLDRPLPSSAGKARCHGPLSSFPVWQHQADALTTYVVSSRTGEAQRVKDFAGPLGDGFLFRDEQGALFLQRGQSRQRLAPAECGAQVVHADAERRLVLAACRGPQTDAKPRRSRKKRAPTPPRARLPLWLFGEGLALDLGLGLGPTGADRWAEGAPRLVPIHAGAERRLLDMDKRTLLPLGATDSVLTTFGTRALLIREREIELIDAVQGQRLLELAHTELLPSVLVASGMAWVSPHVIDLERARVVGATEGAVFALSETGQVLQTEQAARAGMLPQGPLVWRTPRSL